ncbi:hypothetical protein HYV12_00255 [Candidatus Dojkabacteria bacterium]|nr:hypothetical protein [Candidatus Dojkabacteria bacterium]
MDISPAEPLVTDLLNVMLPHFPQDIFFFYFGLFEISIALSFLFPKITKLSIFLASIHLISCFLPLFLLPHYTWQAPWVLTQTGQYIVKNIFIVAGLIGLASYEE